MAEEKTTYKYPDAKDWKGYIWHTKKQKYYYVRVKWNEDKSDYKLNVSLSTSQTGSTTPVDKDDPVYQEINNRYVIPALAGENKEIFYLEDAGTEKPAFYNMSSPKWKGEQVGNIKVPITEQEYIKPVKGYKPTIKLEPNTSTTIPTPDQAKQGAFYKNNETNIVYVFDDGQYRPLDEYNESLNAEDYNIVEQEEQKIEKTENLDNQEKFLAEEGVLAKVDDIAKKHGFTSADLLNVIQKESNFDPKARNKKGGATGLIQFYGDLYEEEGKTKTRDYKTINGVQYKLDDIKEMSSLEQLNLVDQYFTENHTAGQDPYITVAYPAAAQMGLDDIIGGADSKIAKQNPLWVDKNGNVTKRSIMDYGSLGGSKSQELLDWQTSLNEEELNTIGGYTLDGSIGEGLTEFKNQEGQVVVQLENNKLIYKDPNTGDQLHIGTINEKGGNYTFEKTDNYKTVFDNPVYLQDHKNLILAIEKASQDNPDFTNKIIESSKGADIIGPDDLKNLASTRTTLQGFGDPDISTPEDPITIGGEYPEVKITEQKTDPVLADDTGVEQKQTTAGKIAGVADAVFQGAGALLDKIGGPGAIISYIMGKKGLEAAMKEVEPQKSPELSPMFMQHLRQTRELAKKGFHPEQAKKFRKELDKSYQIGLENAVRGSGGQRARFLAQSGVLDAQRSAALLDYAAKDEELQAANQDKYEKMMLFKENFDIQRTEQQRAEDMARQLADKKAAAGFTSAAFSSLMSNYANSSSIANQFAQGGTSLYNPLVNMGLLNQDQLGNLGGNNQTQEEE